MPFTTNLSGTTQVDDSIVLAYDQSFIVAVGQNENLSQVATYKQDIGAKSITLPKYSRLSISTTPLTETDDVTSLAMADAGITVTPLEYGTAVTKTQLATLQTGGKVDVAAATLVGINAGQTRDALAIAAMDASSNTYIVGGKAAGSVLAADTASIAFVNTMYNKLSRASVPKINGSYIMIAHDDVIHDLRSDANAGSWTDVNKYSKPEEVMSNEVGMFRGFRVIRNNLATFVDQTGTGLVDLYSSYFLGFNGLGLVESKAPTMVATGPFDKLARFVNLGWYGVFAYKIIDTDACWVGQCASSVGQNAA